MRLDKCIWKYMLEEEEAKGKLNQKTKPYAGKCEMCYGFGLYLDPKEKMYRDCRDYIPIREILKDKRELYSLN